MRSTLFAVALICSNCSWCRALETAPAQTSAAARLGRNNLLVYRDGQGDPQPVKSVRDWQKRRAEIVR
jgi:hypothetical protein